ncbi:hypothetical protein T265_00775 [Opisthorchis viverrini]|uniref:Uncharacterized protein n=1 Tax=Opisthorchis viverrini TaxID=6198 RepID=A0A075A4R8_OPIVI|nr:hypothetical protein T265_00775 [Opisthorchis viverrini]KER33267.1 hypothetical protein T265_00775 [Opisthorchis viverrini]
MRVLALASIVPHVENIKSSATSFIHLCLSATDRKDQNRPGKLGQLPGSCFRIGNLKSWTAKFL